MEATIEKKKAGAELNRSMLAPKLRFKGFDDDWNDKKLGDVLEITSASRVHKDEWTEKGVPFFRSSDVVAAFKGTENTKAYISFELYTSLANKTGRVKKDDLLVTGGGTIGIPFLIKNNDPLYFKDADLLWIKNSNEINGYFLYSFFLTQSFKNYINITSHVGTIAHYTVIQAKNTPFQFPTLPEQQKIASFLSAVDEKIQQLSRKKELLEQYKKGVMQQLFSGKLRFKDEKGKEYPKWEEKRLGDLCKTARSGGTPQSTKREYYNGDIPFLSINDMTTQGKYLHFTSNHISQLGLENSSSWVVPTNTIIYSMYASVGFVAINKIPLATSQAVLNLIPKENIDTEFIYYSLIDFQKKVSKFITTGTQGNLNAQTVKDFEIHLPCLEEQQKIANYLTQIDKKIATVNEQMRQTQEFKKGLLQGMFV